MSLFNSLSSEVKLFVYEQELATVNATIEALDYFGVVSKTSAPFSPLEKRREELEIEIAKIQEVHNNIFEANKKWLKDEMQRIPYE